MNYNPLLLSTDKKGFIKSNRMKHSIKESFLPQQNEINPLLSEREMDNVHPRCCATTRSLFCSRSLFLFLFKAPRAHFSCFMIQTDAVASWCLFIFFYFLRKGKMELVKWERVKFMAQLESWKIRRKKFCCSTEQSP